MTEQTLVLIKPDGVKRNLIGEIISRIEAKGYVVIDIKKLTPSIELLANHYAEHEGKPFYEPLVEFMSSGDVVALKVEGNRVIEGFRALAGATDPTAEAARAGGLGS
jgi:nucleoside-diphosphate kinase